MGIQKLQKITIQFCTVGNPPKGKTLADLAGIKVEGSDKWKTLIQNASLKNNDARCKAN